MARRDELTMTTDGRPHVSTLFPEQYQQTAIALGRAFISDPPLNAILPEIKEPIERARRLGIMFQALLNMQRRSGQPVFGVVADGRVAGAAIVEGSGHSSATGIVLSGTAELMRMVKGLGWGGMLRGINLMNTLMQNHPRESHIYLNFLGVDPDHQRRHIGVALLEHLRETAAGRPDLAGVYLETATEANVAFYSRNGYEVLGELYPLGVRMWRMFQRTR
ncbi:MAG TPA: GNAT family N-acetyltransferase [Candidatus Binataceae bacterium]